MGRLPCILTVKDKPASCTCVQHHSSGRIVRGEEGAHSYWRVFRGKEVGHSSGRVSGGEEGAHKRCFLDQPCPLCKQADQWSVFNAEQEKSTAMSACLYRSVPAPLRDDRMHFLHRLFRLCMMALECACCVACRRICGIAHKPAHCKETCSMQAVMGTASNFRPETLIIAFAPGFRAQGLVPVNATPVLGTLKEWHAVCPHEKWHPRKSSRR
eukprot:366545-Chlamydomonas_euryale.AAC.5